MHTPYTRVDTRVSREEPREEPMRTAAATAAMRRGERNASQQRLASVQLLRHSSAMRLLGENELLTAALVKSKPPRVLGRVAFEKRISDDC